MEEGTEEALRLKWGSWADWLNDPHIPHIYQNRVSVPHCAYTYTVPSRKTHTHTHTHTHTFRRPPTPTVSLIAFLTSPLPLPPTLPLLASDNQTTWLHLAACIWVRTTCSLSYFQEHNCAVCLLCIICQCRIKEKVRGERKTSLRY